MPLLAFLASNPKEVAQLTIEQIVTMAGDGVLKDTSTCCSEFREYLKQTDSAKLGHYAERCLSSTFPNSGFVLQDLINELGRRLDYKVSNGRYRGTQNSVGFDGIWLSPEGQTIVTEVKTTDAYTVKLDTIATPVPNFSIPAKLKTRLPFLLSSADRILVNSKRKFGDHATHGTFE